LVLVEHETCEEYWTTQADEMQDRSFTLSWFWAILVFVCIFGNMISFYGFGNASERLNRRVRDSAFYSLVCQEVAFFERRSVGKITSELQEDATRIQTFTGDPIRSLLIALSSVITGLVLSFTFMWPFALLAVACIPLMGFATTLDMKNMLGDDEGVESGNDVTTSPSGIVVETLLNMGTVSALTMEEERFNIFKEALNNSDEHYIRDGFNQGVLAGLSQFIQQWINALQMFWGGWLLFNYPDRFDFNDFLISNFAILFSLFGLGAAFQDVADRKETEKSASRIFYLLDRVSQIDPLSKEGKILDTTVDRLMKPKRKSSIKKKTSSTKKMTKNPKDRKSSLKVVEESSESEVIAETIVLPVAEDVPIVIAHAVTDEEQVMTKQGSKKKKKPKKPSSKKIIETSKNSDDITEGVEDGDVGEGKEGNDISNRPPSLKKEKSSKKKKPPSLNKEKSLKKKKKSKLNEDNIDTPPDSTD